jgi:hypothetical protein
MKKIMPQTTQLRESATQIKFGRPHDLDDVINCAKFWLRRFKGFALTTSRKSPFRTLSYRRPTTQRNALPRQHVI